MQKLKSDWVSVIFLCVCVSDFLNCTELTVYTLPLPHCVQSQAGWAAASTTCLLHTGGRLARCTRGCAPFTLGTISDRWGGWDWGLSEAHPLLTHLTHTHKGKPRLSLSLSLTFTQSHSWEPVETPGWGVGEGGQWVLSGGGNLTGLPTRWKPSASPLPLLLLLLLPLLLCSIHLPFTYTCSCFFLPFFQGLSSLHSSIISTPRTLTHKCVPVPLRLCNS